MSDHLLIKSDNLHSVQGEDYADQNKLIQNQYDEFKSNSITNLIKMVTAVEKSSLARPAIASQLL